MPNMNDFLTRFFEQRHFNRMPPAERARLDDFLRDNNLVGDMPHWRDHLMHRVGNGYVENPLTPWAQLDPGNNGRDRLYTTLQNIFNQLYSDSDAMSNGAVANFVNRYFVVENIFDHGVTQNLADAATEAECNNLHALLTAGTPAANAARNRLALYLNDPSIPSGQRISIADFINGLDPARREYNSNQNFQDTLLRISRTILMEDPAIAALFPGVQFEDIFNGFTVTPPINPARMTALEHHYQGILNAIHDNKDVAEAVKKTNGGARITGPLEAALKRVNYDDKESANHVPPKFADRKTFLQRVDAKVKDFKKDKLDSWGRILTLRGTRRFFSPGAKDIVDAIKKTKTKDGKPIKPTAGLKGILAAKDDIAKSLAKSPQGREHFKWFTKCLESIAAETPDAFNGALKNPEQMRDVIGQVIYRAVQEGKSSSIDAAKSTMEVLSTMKYSIMDSATIDALKAELKDKKWLSDDKLYWNKYEGIKFVTSAFDKAAKYAMLTMGRGVAAIRNIHNLTHLKFKGSRNRHDYAFSAAQQQFRTDRHNQWADMHARAPGILANLAAGAGPSGVPIANAADLANARDVILPGLTGDARANLQFDIDQYVAATQAANEATWNEAHPDRYTELMGYWDMLESHWKSHRFTFSAKALQDRFHSARPGNANDVWNESLRQYRAQYGT